MYVNSREPFLAGRFQTEITLNTVEAIYIALAIALREIISLMALMEVVNKMFPLHIMKPEFVCSVREKKPVLHQHGHFY